MGLDFRIRVKAGNRFRHHSHRGDNWTVRGDEDTREDYVKIKGPGTNSGGHLHLRVLKGRRTKQGAETSKQPKR
jgi:hypothetical protein